MNFALDHFELHFPPEIIPAGENLYDRNAISMFEEIEKNLWSFDIKDGHSYEIEILISPSKVVNYSCDCSVFTSEGHCKHIVAALFQLRMLKTKKVERNVKVIRSVPKKLNIPNILNQIKQDELNNFIRNYARKDKKFSTALKATFARKIELENNEEKYESILNSVIRPATGADYSVSAQSVKQLLSVAGQFDAQFEDAVSLKQYTEAFYIVKSLLGKIAYVNHWTNSEHELILEANKHFHKQFRLLLELEIAPSLEREMVKFGVELAGRSYYHIAHAEHNLFLILLDPLKLDTNEDQLVDLLTNKLGSELLHDYELEKIWTIRQYFVEKQIELPAQKTPKLSSHSVYRISDRLEEFRAFVGLRDFLNLFMVNGQIKDSFLIKHYVKVLKKIGTKEELVEAAMNSLVVHKDLYFYELLKNSFPADAEAFYHIVSERISEKKSIDFHKLYLEILQEDDRIDELVAYLQSSKHALKLIYDQAEYISTRSNKLTEVLITLSDKYLKEYMGKESSVEMRKLLLFLRRNKWEKELSKLQKHLLRDYVDRKSLNAEIRDF